MNSLVVYSYPAAPLMSEAGQATGQTHHDHLPVQLSPGQKFTMHMPFPIQVSYASLLLHQISSKDKICMLIKQDRDCVLAIQAAMFKETAWFTRLTSSSIRAEDLAPILCNPVGLFHQCRHQSRGAFIDQLLHPLHSSFLIHVQTQLFLRQNALPSDYPKLNKY